MAAAPRMLLLWLPGALLLLSGLLLSGLPLSKLMPLDLDGAHAGFGLAVHHAVDRLESEGISIDGRDDVGGRDLSSVAQNALGLYHPAAVFLNPKGVRVAAIRGEHPRAYRTGHRIPADAL